METKGNRRRNRERVLVVGGGPAGAIAAAALARKGLSVLLLERERFPRFHIGESLLPASMPIFETLGLTPKLEQERFVEKGGATFILEDGSAHFRVRFADALGGDGRAWHVLRARFDEILLRHAEECGAEVVEAAMATGVEFGPEGVRLDWTDSAGAHHTAEADDLIDASGRHGFLAHRLGLRRPTPTLRKVSVYAHLDRPVSIPGAANGDIVVVSRRDLGWLWVIPLPGGRTSIGAVFDREEHQAGSAPSEVLRDRVASTPVLRDLLLDGLPDEGVRFEGDFSYSASSYSGSNWLLAGDAGAFLDPVFSTGVHFAVSSGWDAAQTLLDGRSRARRRFARRTRRRIRHFERFVLGFYDRSFRDVLFAPQGAPSIARAITGLLAGAPPRGLVARARIRSFHAVTRLQRFFPLVPRVHGRHGHAR